MTTIAQHVPTRQRDPWHEYAAGRLTPAEIRELAAQTPPIALARRARHRKPAVNTVRQYAARSWAFARVLFRAARILATSRDLPVLLRVLFVIGCIQIPVLPFDEIALAIALGWLALFHRGTLRGALAKARGEVAGNHS